MPNFASRFLARLGYHDETRVQALIEQALKAQGKERADYVDWQLAYAQAMRWAIPDGAQVEGQATLYQKLTWIATAIDVLANAAASSDYGVYQRQGEDKQAIVNHAFEIKLDQPNPLQSRFEFWRDYFSYRILTGNVYLFLNRPGPTAPPDELWVVPTQFIKPVPDGKSYLLGYLVTPGVGRPEPLETWQISHNKSFNARNQFVGLSALTSLATPASAEMAEEQWEANFWGKDNAKIPGLIAFADMVNDTEWERLKKEKDENWGGLERRGPMMLRGVGRGGVEWLQMTLSARDLQVIDKRKFTKEEIYSRLAPGLAAMLDVSSTEANAIAGKSVFLEFALWPLLQQAAQKISSDVMPAYGENLLFEFDDVRETNRLIDLDEQREYGKTHTIDEIRQEYHNDEPLPGGAGQRLIAEIGTQTPVSAPALETNTPLPEPETALPPGKAIADELRAWENFALKRLGRVGGRDFEPRAVSLFQAARLHAALRGCRTETEVRAVFRAEQQPENAAHELAAAMNNLAEAVKEK